MGKNFRPYRRGGGFHIFRIMLVVWMELLGWATISMLIDGAFVADSFIRHQKRFGDNRAVQKFHARRYSRVTHPSVVVTRWASSMNVGVGDASLSSSSSLSEGVGREGSKQNQKSSESSSTGPTGSKEGPNYLSPELVDLVRESADLVEVVESAGLEGFVRISGPDGGGAKAICPFHDDNRPSLSVSSSRKLYKCFACGHGGDVFGFVRDLHNLRIAAGAGRGRNGDASSDNNNNNNKKMDFVGSVRYVAEHFTDVVLPTVSTFNMSAEEKAQYLLREEKKKRILLANAAAAEFYGRCLLSPSLGGPGAGMARTHLREDRGLSAHTVRDFAIGYAPLSSQHSNSQPQMSLLEHLRNLGFRADEVVEAGLALRRQPYNKVVVAVDRSKSVSANSTNENATSSSEQTELVYEDIWDRFRGRLMVPIFDAGGKNVIAFGGRHLDDPNGSSKSSSSSYVPPKYLNSPESLVFRKKEVWFGVHWLQRKAEEEEDVKNTVVVVEGYFDVLSLHDAGFRDAVACMGTSLTVEAVASLVRLSGRTDVVLCLDGDEAGRSAMERFCGCGDQIFGSLFSSTSTGSSTSTSTSTSSTVDADIRLRVATLPDDIKDPSDFVKRYRTINRTIGGTRKSAKNQIVNDTLTAFQT